MLLIAILIHGKFFTAALFRNDASQAEFICFSCTVGYNFVGSTFCPLYFRAQWGNNTIIAEFSINSVCFVPALVVELAKHAELIGWIIGLIAAHSLVKGYRSSITALHGNGTFTIVRADAVYSIITIPDGADKFVIAVHFHTALAILFNGLGSTVCSIRTGFSVQQFTDRLAAANHFVTIFV